MTARDVALDILKATGLFAPVRRAARMARNAVYRLRGDGLARFNQMQKREYRRYTTNFEDAKELCVGAFQDHERYPYEERLLERYEGPKGRALDFGCGIGRMIKRMLAEFEHVDGIDLMDENLAFARRYLGEEHGIPADRYELFKSDGLGCRIPGAQPYDFIYSTICLQHIPVYEVRKAIFEDLLKLLRPGGRACLQVGAGWDSGIGWFENFYAARGTNAKCDASIPDLAELDAIKADFEAMGYVDVSFTSYPSPHGPGGDYHALWLFIHLKRPEQASA